MSRKSCTVRYEIKKEKYSSLGNISENAYLSTLEKPKQYAKNWEVSIFTENSA